MIANNDAGCVRDSVVIVWADVDVIFDVACDVKELLSLLVLVMISLAVYAFIGLAILVVIAVADIVDKRESAIFLICYVSRI